MLQDGRNVFWRIQGIAFVLQDAVTQRQSTVYDPPRILRYLAVKGEIWIPKGVVPSQVNCNNAAPDSDTPYLDSNFLMSAHVS